MTLAELAPEEVLGARRDEIEALWTRVWPTATHARFDEILPRHAARRGFRFVAALDGAELLGFAYGYLGVPGEWWHDQVAAAMPEPQRRRWLAPGNFELVELMVDPVHRRRGIGRALHDELLREHGGAVVLSTQTDNVEAIALYRSLGYEIVVPEIDLGGGERMYCVLGLELRR